MLISIADATADCLSDYRNIPDPELVARNGVFVAEGRLVVERLLTGARFQTRSVMVTQPALASLSGVLDPHGPLPIYLVPQEVMNTVTGFHIHRGCLAIGIRRPVEPWTATIAGARCVVVLECVSNADNVGGIFRSAAAFGADAVLLGPGCADPLYRKAIRTSMGAALAIPFAQPDAWPEALGKISELGFTIVAMSLGGDTAPLREVASRIGSRRVAVLLGHEGTGLSEEALALSTIRARVPITNDVDSLNVATAAAIALYEISASR